MTSIRIFNAPRRAAGRHRRMVACITPLAVVALGAAVVLPTATSGAAQAPVGLATATSFVVLAGAGVTNTGPTTLGGDIGTFPTTAEPGYNSVVQASGTNHDGDSVTQGAKNDLITGYNQAAGATPSTVVATELGGHTFLPGVYNAGTLGITGQMTLNTLGDPNAVFIFKAASTLITASASSIVVIGSTNACNVFWQIGSSATLGSGSSLVGSVLALTSITANTGATIQGRLLARNGAVTLDTNTITTPVCAAAVTTTAASGTPTTATPTTVTPTTVRVTPTTVRGTTTTLASGAAPVLGTTPTTTAPGTGTGTGTPALPGTPGTPATPAVPGTPGTGTPALPHTL
jgi:type VI secretion system secreted protein VgrG